MSQQGRLEPALGHTEGESGLGWGLLKETKVQGRERAPGDRRRDVGLGAGRGRLPRAGRVQTSPREAGAAQRREGSRVTEGQTLRAGMF